MQREWRNGDTVKIQVPMELHTEFLPGSTNEIALLYGPIALAGELGTNGMPSNLYARGQGDLNRVPTPAVPSLVTTPDSLVSHVKAVRGKPLTFRTKGIGQPQDVTLIPFYETHHERYSVYWKLMSEAAWKSQTASVTPAK